jgi:hypothetical protein
VNLLGFRGISLPEGFRQQGGLSQAEGIGQLVLNECGSGTIIIISQIKLPKLNFLETGNLITCGVRLPESGSLVIVQP